MGGNRVRATPRRLGIRMWAVAATAAIAIAGCSTAVDTSGLEAQLADVTAENAALADQLEETDDARSNAIADLNAALSDAANATTELTDARDDVGQLSNTVDRLNSTIRARDSEIQRQRRELEEEREKTLALMLAFGEELSAARDDVSRAAKSFACTYGTEFLETGGLSSSIKAASVYRAFLSSEEYSSLIAASPATASLMDLVSDPEDALNAPVEDVLVAPAVACWQSADEKANAALYEYESIFREAVLDAACTHGADDAYTDYRRTSAYQSWILEVGDDIESDYLGSVKDRYGTIESFLAIPETDIEAESARCDDIRELIEPKGSGTWNVGDEIKPGTWKAYDESDCYWARLAVNGDIRANHFGDALRLSVNVSASDGQFEISGCRFYYANP